MVTHQSSHPAGDGRWGQPPGRPQGHRTSPGLRGQRRCFLKCENALGFVISFWLLDFASISACSERKDRALPVRGAPCTYRLACALQGVFPGWWAASPFRREPAVLLRQVEQHIPRQGASDLRLPNAASLLNLRWPMRRALGGRRAQRHAATESRHREPAPRRDPPQKLQELLPKSQPMPVDACRALRKRTEDASITNQLLSTQEHLFFFYSNSRLRIYLFNFFVVRCLFLQ